MANPPSSGKKYEDGYDAKYGYNANAFEHKAPLQKVIAAVMQNVIAPPIALTSEAFAARKQRKQSASSTENDAKKDEASAGPSLEDQDTVEPTQENGDENDWALDECLDDEETPGLNQEKPPPYTQFMSRTPSPSITPVSPLPCPVIIPQRRPGTKTRGFIRAYAPMLENANIDQETFLQFLKSFHAASQASPIFDVLIVAAAAVGWWPNGIAQAVSISVYTAAKVGQEIHERLRANSFLDEVNEKFFRPRGLYAMVMAYKPSEDGSNTVYSERIDQSTLSIAKWGGTGGGLRRLRLYSNVSRNEDQLPVECAPLTFPTLESAAVNLKQSDKSGQALLAKCTNSQKFVQNYFDKRAQATFGSAQKDSVLAALTPTPEFHSKMGDPKDGRNVHLITLLTGGKVQAEPLGGKRRWEKAQAKEAQRRAQGQRTSTKRFLHEDVLYLTIVNMPSEAELEAARAELERQKAMRKAQANARD